MGKLKNIYVFLRMVKSINFGYMHIAIQLFFIIYYNITLLQQLVFYNEFYYMYLSSFNNFIFNLQLYKMVHGTQYSVMS